MPMLKRLIIALTVLAIGAMAVTASAMPPTLEASLLPASLSFEVTPSKLPSRTPAPVRMLASAKYRTSDGSHVPALKELRLEVDRHLALELKGVPVCPRSSLDIRRGVREVEERCGDSIIGRGEISAEAAFPNQPPTAVTSKLIVFNVGRGSDGVELGAYAYFPAPVTGALAFLVKVREIDDGRFGWQARATIPKIAGGAGSITGYSLRIGKRFLSATCVGGKLELRTLSTFVGGARLSEPAVRACSVLR